MYLCLITVAFYVILVTVTMYNTILPSTLTFSTSTPKSKSVRKKKKNPLEKWLCFVCGDWWLG